MIISDQCILYCVHVHFLELFSFSPLYIIPIFLPDKFVDDINILIRNLVFLSWFWWLSSFLNEYLVINRKKSSLIKLNHIFLLLYCYLQEKGVNFEFLRAGSFNTISKSNHGSYICTPGFKAICSDGHESAYLILINNKEEILDACINTSSIDCIWFSDIVPELSAYFNVNLFTNLWNGRNWMLRTLWGIRLIWRILNNCCECWVE